MAADNVTHPDLSIVLNYLSMDTTSFYGAPDKSSKYEVKAFKTSEISPSDMDCCERRNCFHGDLEGGKNLNNDVI